MQRGEGGDQNQDGKKIGKRKDQRLSQWKMNMKKKEKQI